MTSAHYQNLRTDAHSQPTSLTLSSFPSLCV